MAYLHLAAGPNHLLNLLLKLSRQDLPSCLSPIWLLELLLHYIDLGLLLEQTFSDVSNVASHLVLLLPHVLFDETVAFPKNGVDHMQHFLSHASKLIA
jgi:hypothetical protein